MGDWDDGEHSDKIDPVYNRHNANAITHAGEDKIVVLTVTRRGNRIRVEVADHGDGIPEEVLPYVWERYFKTAQRKRNKKGSGLGLAISREIVERHKGTYGVDNSVGGSLFWFELPSF